MNMNAKHIHSKLITRFKICLTALFTLAAMLGWQHMQLARKDRKISALLTENDTLKKSIISIDNELLELKDAASDVRLFQKEVIKVMQDIDPNYSVHFAKTSSTKPDCGFTGSLDYDALNAVTNAKENLFFLSNTQGKLLFDTAGLLGQAVSLRDMFEKTPTLIPVAGGYISSEFGPRRDPISGQIKNHFGIDIAAPIGTPVHVSADGVVRRANLDREFGNVIEVVHANGYVTTYGHLSEILTKVNARVKQGDTIGKVGKTGLRCKGAHLHVGVSKNGVKLNPKNFMKRSLANFF